MEETEIKALRLYGKPVGWLHQYDDGSIKAQVWIGEFSDSLALRLKTIGLTQDPDDKCVFWLNKKEPANG
jgi:hypothetical protein